MLLFKTILLITIVCFVLTYFANRENWDFIFVLACLIAIIGTVVSLAMGAAIANENSSTYIQSTITDKTIEYNGLIRELELVEAGDESLDKSIVYKAVLEYNSSVTTYKENAYNRWLTGLYNKEIADNLQLIEF